MSYLNNSSFSLQVPKLQLGWDSTSLGLLKSCPKLYEYSIIQGFGPREESVHLTFGILYHQALERYDHYKAQGLTHDKATLRCVEWMLHATWDKRMGRPWISDMREKTRFTLVRTVVWFLEQFADDPIETVILRNGKPAVELSFRLGMDDFVASTGEEYVLCGHLDRIGKLNDDYFIVDKKTSKGPVDANFFSKFSPDNQMSLYSFAGKIVYEVPIRGVIIDGAQVGVTFSRLQRGFVPRTDGQLREWYDSTKFWIKQAEHFALSDYWPMNDKFCAMYGGCAFREVCSKSPEVRQEWLPKMMKSRQWDPLKTRGDI
jgi:hypothetical protein